MCPKSVVLLFCRTNEVCKFIIDLFAFFRDELVFGRHVVCQGIGHHMLLWFLHGHACPQFCVESRCNGDDNNESHIKYANLKYLEYQRCDTFLGQCFMR